MQQKIVAQKLLHKKNATRKMQQKIVAQKLLHKKNATKKMQQKIVAQKSLDKKVQQLILLGIRRLLEKK